MDEPTNPPAHSKKSFTWFFITMWLVSTGLAGWFYYQNRQLKQQITLITETPNVQVSPTVTILNSSPSPAPSNNLFPRLPIVVFESPLSSNDYASQRAEIQQKIIEPYIAYYNHAYDENYTVSLLIQTQSNENIKSQYPYSLIGINKDGSFHGEAIMQDGGKLSWWTPTCMGPCDYSEEFKQKYPQIVSITNPN